MDFTAQNRLRSSSAPVTLDMLFNPGYVLYRPTMVMDAREHLAIPLPSPHLFVDYSSIPSRPVHNAPPSLNGLTVSPKQRRPYFPSASVSYPVLPVSAHKPGGFREATLHTKNPMADNSAERSPKRPPKLHLFASRKSNIVELSAANFPEPPVEWLIGGSTSPSIDSSSVSSVIPSENTSEDESDFAETSPVPLEGYTSGSESAMGANNAACRDLSNGLKALLKVQA